MNITIVGAPDPVEGWAALFDRQYDLSGREYPNGKNADKKMLFEVDDRKAEKIMNGIASYSQSLETNEE